MGLILAYSLRNLLTRKMTTVLTAAGMALVVFAFASIIMLAEGLERTLVDTGSDDNVVVLRRGSGSEVQSGVGRDQAAIVETQPEIALGPDGKKLVARELVVLVTMTRRASETSANVVVRGVSENSYLLRPQVQLAEGRIPSPGVNEVVVGQSIAQRFKGAELGNELFIGGRNWRVVGIFDAGNTGFSSEIWGDVDQFMQTFRRPAYSSVIFRLSRTDLYASVRNRMDSDPRLTLEAKRETQYYRDQSRALSTFLRVLGVTLTLVFSFGAIVGAMITMHSAVANRTGEIGTLRALGFQRRTILLAFLVESLALGFIGGAVGLAGASFLQFFTVSTTNFQTFSELAFSFTLTFDIVYKAMSFSLIMGFLGGLLPALRAARMNIVEALREV